MCIQCIMHTNLQEFFPKGKLFLFQVEWMNYIDWCDAVHVHLQQDYCVWDHNFMSLTCACSKYFHLFYLFLPARKWVAWLFPDRSYRRGILESVSCVCLSIRHPILAETTCKSFIIFYMNIKYVMGMMQVFSKFQYYPRWLTGSHCIAQKTYFALVLESYRRFAFSILLGYVLV